MTLDEEFDADEILRDIEEKIPKADDNSEKESEDVREVNFGTRAADNENFKEIADDLEDL